MQYPQLIILESAGWVARQLGELVGENRWLVREPRSEANALTLAREPRPAVLIVEIDPAAERFDGFALIANAHRFSPDVPVVAVSDVKLPDPDRAVWTAMLLDLGARYVLFPPVTKSVLEDLVTGLMGVVIRRVVGGELPPPTPRPPSEPDGPIDLAEVGE
jgi:hypothetical protein